MRYAGVLGTVALTELMAHFLSLGWAMMTLLAAFAWVALSGASVAAKARSTEDRVNALVPAIGTAYTLAGNALPKSGGTVTGSLTVNGAHTAGSLYVSGNATTNGSHQVNGNHTVSGNISGGTDVSANNNLNAGNNVNAGSQVTTYQIYVNGTRLNMQQGAGGWPISSGQAWGPSVVNVLNQLASAANNTGAFST